MHDNLGCLAALEEMVCLVPLVDADLMRNHLVRIDLALAHELQRRLPVMRVLTAAADDGQLLLDDLGKIDGHLILCEKPDLYVLTALLEKIHAELHGGHGTRAVIADICAVAFSQLSDQLLHIFLLHVHDMLDTEFLLCNRQAPHILREPRHHHAPTIRHDNLRHEESDGSGTKDEHNGALVKLRLVDAVVGARCGLRN